MQDTPYDNQWLCLNSQDCLVSPLKSTWDSPGISQPQSYSSVWLRCLMIYDPKTSKVPFFNYQYKSAKKQYYFC